MPWIRNYKKRSIKTHKYVEAKQYATKQPMNHWGNQKLPIDKRKWKHNHPKPMGHSRSSPKMEVYNNKTIPQEAKKISNKQPNITTKRIRKRRTNKT